LLTLLLPFVWVLRLIGRVKELLLEDPVALCNIIGEFVLLKKFSIHPIEPLNDNGQFFLSLYKDSLELLQMGLIFGLE